MSDKKYILNYFNKHGKVELCRLILAASNVDYEDNFIENLTDSDTTLAFMPYLQIEDKTKIPLISVICRYLAKEHGLAGADTLEQAKTDAIAQIVMILIDTYYRNVFTMEDIDQKRLNLKEYLANDVENTSDTIENMIALYSTNNGENCVGDKLTYADLFVYEMARHYCPKDDRFVEKYARLFKIKANVEKNERLAEYISKKEATEKGSYPEIKREE